MMFTDKVDFRGTGWKNSQYWGEPAYRRRKSGVTVRLVTDFGRTLATLELLSEFPVAPETSVVGKWQRCYTGCWRARKKQCSGGWAEEIVLNTNPLPQQMRREMRLTLHASFHNWFVCMCCYGTNISNQDVWVRDFIQVIRFPRALMKRACFWITFERSKSIKRSVTSWSNGLACRVKRKKFSHYSRSEEWVRMELERQ